MIDEFPKFISTALLGCVMTGALIGCQPTSEQPVSATDNINDTDHVTYSDEEHSETMEHHDERAGDDHSNHDHGSKTTSFNCEPNATIGVYYHNDDTPQTAHLLIDGIEYDLETPTDGNNGSTAPLYMSDIGLDDTYGIIWQPSGDSATLSRKTLGSDIAPANEEVLYNCQKVSS